MELQELKIQKKEWGQDEGKHAGWIKFSDKEGSINLKLTPDHCDQIFRICADSILATARSAAENLTCSVIEHKKLLETPALED